MVAMLDVASCKAADALVRAGLRSLRYRFAGRSDLRSPEKTL
jgi:hypothetical protein